MTRDQESRPGRIERFRKALQHAFALPEVKPLTEQERRWLEMLAREVVRRQMGQPALFLLEGSKPLSHLGSQVLVFFKPMISMLFDPENCDRVADLLSRRGSLDKLMDLIKKYRAEGTQDENQQ
jgi:hypothetical protein